MLATAPTIIDITNAGPNVVVTWSALSNATYRVQYVSTMPGTNWQNIVPDITATNSNLNSTNWKVWAGFRPISLFAVEADYMDLGSQNVTSSFVTGSSTTHLDYKAFAGYAVGYVPIPVP